MHNRSRATRWLLTASLATFIGCATGGGGTSGPNDTTDFLPFVTGFLGDTEVWMVAADTFLVGGYGPNVEFAILTTNPDAGDSCLGIHPSGGLRYENGQLTADVAYADIGANRNCQVEFSADAAACDPSVQTATTCNLTEGSGRVRVGSRSADIGSPRIARFEPCTPPASLEDIGQWTIQNTHILPLAFLAEPEDVGATVILGGDSTGERLVTIITSTSPDGSTAEGCFDQSPQGTISFDGTSLVIDVTLEGDDNDSGLGEPGACSIQFQGTVTYCCEFAPEAIGGNSADSAAIIRIDGTGTYQFKSVSGTMQFMYLNLLEESNSGPPDGVRV